MQQKKHKIAEEAQAKAMKAAEEAAQKKVENAQAAKDNAQAAKDREEQKFNEALGNYTKAVLYKKTLESELEEAEEAVKTAKG